MKRLNAVACLLGLVILGCGAGAPHGAPAPTPSASATPSQTSTPSGTPVPSSPGWASAAPSPSGPASSVAATTVSVYYLRDGHIAAAHRGIAGTAAVAGAAVRSLFSGPTEAEASAGLSTAVPAGAHLLSLVIDGTIATVNLGRSFTSGGGGASMAARLAQVVFTVTQFPSVTGVEFQLDGVNTVVFGAGGLVLDRPASRASFPDLTPAILVENPTPDDAILSPLLVTGVANTFEGETSFRLLDASGRTLAEAQGTGGTMGSWGRFTASLRFNAGDAAGSTGALVGYDHSPKDGSPVDVVKIPIRFSP